MAPKTSKAPKKMLTYPGSTCVPLVMERRFWTKALVVKDYFWDQVEKNKTEVSFPFEQSLSSSGEATLEHQAPFMDHKGREGILLHPRSILRMRVEKGEVC